MIGTQRTDMTQDIENILEEGRAIDVYNDPDSVRLTAANMEMMMRNLLNSKCMQECITLMADICTHRLVALHTADGSIKVIVTET
ncbi:MAG: hypothetical protein HXY34_01695 [Candidatus Thorarchaeota archaeon]|nr:hypothetical protein [Candidatus Thorarchaeota archaeon]